MPTLTSDTVNYLVWRYLQEEGLDLAAYALNKESQVGNLDPELRPNVSESELVRLLLRGIELSEIESQAKNSSAEPPGEESTIQGLKVVKEICGGAECVFAGDELVVSGKDEDVTAYGAEREDKLSCTDTPTCLTPLANGVLIGYASGSMRHWILDSSPVALQSVLLPEIDSPTLSIDSLSPVTVIRASPSGERCAVLHASGLVCVWDLLERQLISWYADFAPVNDLCWLGEASITLANSQGVFLVDKQASKRLPGPPPKPVTTVVFVPKSSLVVAGSDSGLVHVWTRGQASREVKVGEAPISAIAAFDEKSVIAGATDGKIVLIDSISLTVAATIDLNEPVFGVDVWDTVVVATTPIGVRCFEVKDGKFARIAAVNGSVENVACSRGSLAVCTDAVTYVLALK